MKRLSEQEEKERIDLYNQGCSFREIARKLNLSYAVIHYWAKNRGLESKYQKGFDFIHNKKLTSLPEEEHKKRMELYNQGMTDKEIADKCFVCKQAIYAWRKKNNLEKNVKVKLKCIE